MMRQALYAAALAAFFVHHSARAESGQVIESFTLRNGLEVVVAENHRVPMVVHALLYRVGSADDPSGRSGLAHFQEHMMFLGTRTTKPGDYAKLVSRLGGEKNAHTTDDYTIYEAEVAREYLPNVMALEADRMINMAPPPEDFLRERKVIIEERRMRVDNDPGSLLAEAMDAMLYRNHPYRHPAIGWLHEMETLSQADAMAFHQVHYHPNNAVLVLAGDITAKQARPLVQRYYGRLAPAAIPPRAWNEEPPQRGQRRVTLRDDNVKQPIWGRSTMTSSIRHGDTARALPLYLFAQVLGGGTSSRLYQSLVVKQKLAASVSANYEGFRRGPGEFSLSAIPLPGVSMERIEQAVDEEIKAALAQGVTEEELARAKTLYKADTIYARDSLESMAFILAMIRALDLPVAFFNEWPQRIDAVTARQAKEAAAEALGNNPSVTGILLPEEKKP